MNDLSIGFFKDKVLCDVLNMNACHVLLGRPWQHDKRTKHDGFTNIYIVIHEGKTKSMLPVPPHKPIPPPKPKQPVHLVSKRSCEKLVKNGESYWLYLSKK